MTKRNRRNRKTNRTPAIAFPIQRVRGSDILNRSETDRINQIRRANLAPEYRGDNTDAQTRVVMPDSPAEYSTVAPTTVPPNSGPDIAPKVTTVAVPPNCDGIDGETVQPVPEPKTDAAVEEVADDSPTVPLTDMSDQIIQGLRQQIEELQQRLAETTQEAEAAKQEAAAAKADSEQAQKRIHQLFKVAGVQVPSKGIADKGVMFNTVASPYSDRVEGAAAEFEALYRRADCYQHINAAGNLYVVRDTQELDRFVKTHRAELRRDMEQYAKRNGLLRGQNRRLQQNVDAPTTRLDIPDTFLSYLSSVVRITHIPSLIWWQFPSVRLDVSRGQGDTILLPRWNYQPTATTPNDRLLSGGGTYVAITSQRQPITQGSVTAVIKEYGMGASATNGQPIAVPEFVSAYSLVDLEQIVVRNLGYDYRYWEDLTIRTEYDRTTVVWYNDGNVVGYNASAIGPGDDGRLTSTFLDAVYAEMRAWGVPTLDDGCYVACLNTFAAQTLKQSLEDKWTAASESQLQELTSILNLAQSGFADRVSGYLGKYSNIHIFESNAWGVGAAGSPGVQIEALSGTLGDRHMRSSYVFGRDAVARGIGQPFEIRKDDNTDFGRTNSYIWRSEEVIQAVDVDPTLSGDQQQRVFELRTLREAV